MSDDGDHPFRLSDGCSSLQTELAAIQQATLHAAALDSSHVVIHTDSKGAIEVLQHKNLRDNISLTTSILRNIGELEAQGKSVTINWIPSHVGIAGNESADALAKTASAFAEVTLQIRPSLSTLKKAARRRENNITANRNRSYANEGSRSCSWFQGVTSGHLLQLPRNTPRRLRVHLHRLRLGYHCNWRLPRSVQAERPCPHCNLQQEEPLFHWLLQCNGTTELRQVTRRQPVDPTSDGARETAIRILNTLLTHHTDTLCNTISRFPPPR